jgi:hypothetical protein
MSGEDKCSKHRHCHYKGFCPSHGVNLTQIILNLQDNLS